MSTLGGMKTLGEMLRLWRQANHYGTRKLAKIIGISAATLNRVERGESMDAKTFRSVFLWMTEQ